jgi:diguanylate cyclase (GGDEF)-like protein
VVATLVTAGLLAVYGRDALRARRRRTAARGRTALRPRDARESIALVGNALGATHEPRALLPLILHVSVEATGAAGGRVLEGSRELARIGEPSEERPVELDLGSSTDGREITLVLDPPAGGLSPEAEDLVAWLGSQAAIALENARLHHVARREASTDELTGLVNRRRFMEALDGEIARTQRGGARLSVLLADLDDFKRINDRFGHPAGDEALRTFASLLRASLREVDTAARLGGEEFAVLLPETDLEGALVLAERLRRHVGAHAVLLHDGEPVHLTTSIGVAEYQSGPRDELLQHADEGLYRAKQEGKNRVVAGG